MNANEREWSLVLCAVCALPLAARSQTDWTHFGRTPQRDSSATLAPPSLDAPAVIGADETGAPIEWVWQSGVVVGLNHAFATGWSRAEPRVFAVDLSGGAASASVVWSSVVAEPVFDSWSAPVVDESNAAVVVASGEELAAFELFTGSRQWTVMLQGQIVNASPLITDDLGGADRIFITDFSTSGDGRLYCINADPRSASNPFDPGDVVWSTILGETSGNTPTYFDGVVYVATSGGAVLAFDATATSTPEPLWTYEHPSDGFFGGCTVRERMLFAATYGFAGGHLNSDLVKLDAATGEEVWRVPCNRTCATPIVLDDGRIVLSAGVSGFGSQPSVQLFRQTPGGAEIVWDTALDTWDDVNGNQRLDPGEFLVVGGWTHQPIAVRRAGGELLLAGAIPVSGLFFGAFTDLYTLDLNMSPSDPGFVQAHFAGSGATPALTSLGLVTIGGAGLHIFAACYADCDASSGAGVLDIFDFLCFQDRFIAGEAYACDCDVSGGAGVCDVFDFLCFQDRFIAGCD